MPRLAGCTENGRLETGAKKRVPLRGALSLMCRMSNIFFQHFSPSFEGDGEHYGYYAAENERHSVNNSHCRDRCQDCSGNTTTSGYAEKGRHQPNQYPQSFVLSGDFLFQVHNCIYLMFLQPYRSTFFRGCQWLFGGSMLSEDGGRYGCRSAGCRGWRFDRARRADRIVVMCGERGALRTGRRQNPVERRFKELDNRLRANILPSDKYRQGIGKYHQIGT